MSVQASWTFLTNHMHILVVLDRMPDARIRDMAQEIGITERAVQRILAELVEENILKVEKEGRRNYYKINKTKKLRHPLESKISVGQMLELLS